MKKSQTSYDSRIFSKTLGFPCQYFSKISPLPLSILWTLN